MKLATATAAFGGWLTYSCPTVRNKIVVTHAIASVAIVEAVHKPGRRAPRALGFP